MEVLIVQPGSHSKMEALKAFLTALKIDFKTATQEEQQAISNPETIRRIESFEQGKLETRAHSLKEVKVVLNA